MLTLARSLAASLALPLYFMVSDVHTHLAGSWLLLIGWVESPTPARPQNSLSIACSQIPDRVLVDAEVVCRNLCRPVLRRVLRPVL